MSMKVGLSGFGRIGRDVLRAYFEGNVDEFEVVALNASGDLNDLAHLFKYDTMYGKFDGTIEVVEEGFMINDKLVKVVAHRDPLEIPWKELGVELVIDSTGAFRDREGISKHITAGYGSIGTPFSKPVILK